MKIATIVGARPQFIKAATISRAIREQGRLQEILIHTGQHFDTNMSGVFFKELDIPEPDYHLGIGGGTHGQNTGRMIEHIEAILHTEKPDWVIVFGDTDSTLAGALAAVKLHIPVSHIEAGLRSRNRRMPEEINRILTDHMSELLFAPTQTALKNLQVEGISSDRVYLSGDVMYDAALFYQTRAYRPNLLNIREGESFALCTIHRAENTNDSKKLQEIVELLNELVNQIQIVLPLHPRTKQSLYQLTDNPISSKIKIIEPVGYLEMCWLLGQCEFVLTDSGGLQKEAYFNKKPCITLREETEWVELVELGCNELYKTIGEDFSKIVDHIQEKQQEWPKYLYGNGTAAVSIINSIINYTENSAKR